MCASVIPIYTPVSVCHAIILARTIAKWVVCAIPCSCATATNFTGWMKNSRGTGITTFATFTHSILNVCAYASWVLYVRLTWLSRRRWSTCRWLANAERERSFWSCNCANIERPRSLFLPRDPNEFELNTIVCAQPSEHTCTFIQ